MIDCGMQGSTPEKVAAQSSLACAGSLGAEPRKTCGKQDSVLPGKAIAPEEGLAEKQLGHCLHPSPCRASRALEKHTWQEHTLGLVSSGHRGTTAEEMLLDASEWMGDSRH